jgi:hypothetical protein
VHAKRARRLKSIFPPGTRVVIEWDIDPAYSNTNGRFEGVVESYDERGMMEALSHNAERLRLPCGLVRIKAA